MIQKKTNIAFLGNQIAYGGGAKSLLLLIKSLHPLNTNLYLFVTNITSREMKREFENYVKFVKLIQLPELVGAQTESIIRNNQIVNEKLFDLSQVASFADELKSLNIDILHINNSVFAPIYNTIKRTTKVKIITHLREWIAWNGINNKQNYIINSIKRNSDALISISDTEANAFKSHPNINIIANPFEFESLDNFEKNKQLIKSKLGIPSNSFVVGMIGSFQKNKGALDFINAFKYINETKSDIAKLKFVILGGKIPLRFNYFNYYLRKLLKRNTFKYDVFKLLKRNNNLFNNVFFISNQQNVLEIINCFDIAVRPSYSGDPWGRDIIEFMALKKPIIATGSSEFFIKNGKNGFLVPPRDYIQLAEMIYLLFNDKDKRHNFSKATYNSVYSKCNLNIFLSNILAVYRSLLDK